MLVARVLPEPQERGLGEVVPATIPLPSEAHQDAIALDLALLRGGVDPLPVKRVEVESNDLLSDSHSYDPLHILTQRLEPIGDGYFGECRRVLLRSHIADECVGLRSIFGIGVGGKSGILPAIYPLPSDRSQRAIDVLQRPLGRW